ncbi:hypothetical protein Tco_0412027 [Tanacetum coccineum]
MMLPRRLLPKQQYLHFMPLRERAFGTLIVGASAILNPFIRLQVRLQAIYLYKTITQTFSPYSWSKVVVPNISSVDAIGYDVNENTFPMASDNEGIKPEDSSPTGAENLNTNNHDSPNYCISQISNSQSKEGEYNIWAMRWIKKNYLESLTMRFYKDKKGVPHPLSGDYTPKPQEEIDDSLYVYGKKGPQKPEISVSDDNSSEHSTCQSNDSEGSCGNTSEHSFETESESLSEPNEMSKSRLEVTNEKDVSAPKSKEVAPSCVSHIKTPRQPLKDNETHKANRKNWNDMMKRELGEGYSFTKKKCFVCGSLSHLIKDCDYYEKMAREAEVKRVVNTGNGVTKPVWTNANRINHSNKFVPRSVQLNAGRPKFNTLRPNINTEPVTTRPQTVFKSQKDPQLINESKKGFFKIIFIFGDLLLRPQQVIIGGTLDQTSIITEHPLKNMVDRGIFDSGCSGHMTGNKDQLEDFEEFNGGSVTFGGSKGYISGKGRIRVDKPNVKGVSIEMDVLTLTILRIPMKPNSCIFENQANPHAGASEVTNSAGTPTSIASEEKDEEVELIVVPSAVKIPEEKDESRTSSTNSTKEETMTEPKKRRRCLN